MFGTNEITGKKFFKDAPANSLYVTSMFFTIQGEGPYAGMPALFIRLAKCQLACNFCDTFFDQGDWLTYEQIEAKAYATICDHWNANGSPAPLWVLPKIFDYETNTEHKLGPYGCILVVTGGEPLLQDNLYEFLVRQQFLYRHIQIESNGLLNTPVPDFVTFVCSPKCGEKNGIPIGYLKPSDKTLEAIQCLKFVVKRDSQSPYYTVPQWAQEWKVRTGREIYISPMNIYNDVPQQSKILRLTKKGEDLTPSLQERSTVDEVISFWTPGLLNQKENQINHEYAANYALHMGYRLCLQMHLYASMA